MLFAMGMYVKQSHLISGKSLFILFLIKVYLEKFKQKARGGNVPEEKW